MAHIREYLDALASVLNTYAGRDKALRSVSFMLALKAQSSTRKEVVLALAKQCSSARLVLRQFNHPSMIKSCWDLLTTQPTDYFEYFCTTAGTSAYTIYGVVELLAWLSDAHILALDSTQFWRWCLYLWIAALTSGIIRQMRLISKKGLKVDKDLLTLIGLVSDFIVAIHSLPCRVLWSCKLSARHSAAFSLVASLIGFYKAL
uniref:Putative PeRoXisome assembly factor n=1 Tax=Angiostrongylus cantonensis TaxID=6313 RepID=A0A0K0DBB6_ANGCA